MNQALISVIIPVYNVEDYLHECLDSVLQQTYKNIEIIAVNDGSTDNSLKILENYAMKYNNITVISQENAGQSVARNAGLNLAKGKYIYFLDSDDYLLPEAFEDLIETMEKNHLDLIRFAAEPFVDNINVLINKNQYNLNKYFDANKVYTKDEFLKLCLPAFAASPVLYIVKREILIDKQIFFKAGVIHEDELFTLEVFLNCHAVMYKPKFYYKRRYRPNSTMTSQSLKRRKQSFESRCIILKEFNKLLNRYTDENEVKLIKSRIRSVSAAIRNEYHDLDKKFKRKKIQGFDLSHYFETQIS
ncbi:MAG TPA: glycosyltransferase [Bacillota bacterium]|nr:glycosyltransferase [Bacillota bacterium]